MRIRPVGAHALLLDVDDPPAWFAELWRRRAAGEFAATEIVPGAATVLLDGLADPTATADLVRRYRPAPDGPDAPDAPSPPQRPGGPPTAGVDPLSVPVSFDGPDLSDVAGLWGTDEAGVVRCLTTTELRVAFCGFTPGWGYLTGLPAHLRVPRLASPRTRVPAGSVALADAYAGIYPSVSPGGWRIVGHTHVRLFDPDRDPPALLVPGQHVHFREATP
jgi:allophanate hydrolase subunit 1